jgi:class 3 adenylate cyclase
VLQRKVVTVLFCDVVGSTALGETTDPELLRALLARYFQRMSELIENYGGTVEKFIGDAVMAVFGVPVAHEDDALRACRASLEMQKALPELGLEGRIGVNTGEVVTGTDERLATGDAVNVAARLQQAARPGDVLVGAPTLELVREAVAVDELDPLELKGKAQPVPAYRLRTVREAQRRHQMRFVGREQELAAVAEAWGRAHHEQRCELLTIVGEAGVGKSRLVAEALTATDARVVQGRCLPYGEGITYWPVVEVIKQLGALPSDPAAAAAMRSLLGESEAGTTAEEIAWSFRKLLEEAAPLVVVFDDIQWGEETFLDLLEHIALLSTGAALLLLAIARPELAERRASWPVTLRLEPLQGDQVEELIGERLPTEFREQILRFAGGNPLFVSEILAMAEEAGGEVSVPPTLRALLAARLDQLEQAERRVLECGSVEGMLFHRGAVQMLLPEEAQVTPRLAALVRKELVRPEKAQLPGEDGFLFRHLLIRDAAYDGLPKSARADLHERIATWLEEQGRDIVELDEVVGYHLEQAARYAAELGEPDARLSERAGERLAIAGRRALWRGDTHAAGSLLGRALELTRPLGLDVHLELDHAYAVRYIAPAEAAAMAEAAADQALAAGDLAGEALARALAARGYLDIVEHPDVDRVERLARKAIPLLERRGDHAGLVHVWDSLGSVANFHCNYEEMARASEQALHHAELAGQKPRHLFGLESALLYGPRPADEALDVLDAALPEDADPGSVLARARLLAMLRRFDEAWPLVTAATARWKELTGKHTSYALSEVARLAGDLEAAASYMREHCQIYEEYGQRANLSSFAPMLGRLLCDLGRYSEAEPLARLGRELGDRQDILTQMLWRQVLSRVHASRGEHSEAEPLINEAVGLSEETDAIDAQGDAFDDLWDVLRLGNRAEDAASALERALDRYERKRNLAMAERVREKLATPARP